jgi:hypothetical protein
MEIVRSAATGKVKYANILFLKWYVSLCIDTMFENCLKCVSSYMFRLLIWAFQTNDMHSTNTLVYNQHRIRSYNGAVNAHLYGIQQLICFTL